MSQSQKVVAMIPARMGSKRVPKKNLRLLNGKPLICYIIEAAIAANCFDEIYINSEDEIFKEIANHYNIKFYHRPAHLASDEATNDDFAYDFIQNVPSDILVQLLPTSPFLCTSDITRAKNAICNVDGAVGKINTLISVKKIQIECSTNKHGSLNYSRDQKTKPSQSLDPIYSYACGIMAWRTDVYKINMQEIGAAYHGGQKFNSAIMELDGYSTIDIDTEEDFALAECIAKTIAENKTPEPQYYTSGYFNKQPHVEISVPDILKNDGIELTFGIESNDGINESGFNLTSRINNLIVNARGKSWAKCLINNESNSATLICQYKGQGNRKHHHPNWNEWWLIMRGEWEFEIGEQKWFARQDDLIFIPKNIKHKITAIGDGPNVRLAVSRYDVEHVYE